MTGAALPATLAWLLSACVAKRWLARLKPAAQYSVAIGLGAVAGLYGCGLLAISGLLIEAPWLGSASSGALLSSILVAALVMRAKGRTPADTAARLAELQSRIRPHFLFNTLNSAIALVRAEPAKAEALLEDLSDLFRHALMDQDTAVTLADEILHAALRERHYGSFQALTYDEARARFPDDYHRFETRDPEFTFPEGGESLRQFAARIHGTLEGIARRHPNGTVLIVTHGGVLMTLLDVSMATAARSIEPDMGVVTIEMKTSFMRPGLGRLGLGRRIGHRTRAESGALSLALAFAQLGQGQLPEARASYAELANQVAAIAQANTTEGRGA